MPLRRRQWQPTPVLLPGQSHGWRSLVGCSPWGCEESDTIERFHFHFSLSCTGEGNGNPLQCSCLENPRDGGLPSLGLHRVRHDWRDLAAAAAAAGLWNIWYTHIHVENIYIDFQLNVNSPYIWVLSLFLLSSFLYFIIFLSMNMGKCVISK